VPQPTMAELTLSTMFRPRSRLTLTAAVTCWLAIATDAFQANSLTQIALHRQQRQSASKIHHHSTLSGDNENEVHQQDLDQNCNTAVDISRRKYLAQFSTAMTGALLTAPLMAYADDNVEATAEKLETIIKEESELDADILKEEVDEKKSIEDEKELIGELSKEVPDEDKIKEVTKELIKEEEQLKNETEEMITKMETMESDLKAVDDTSASIAEEEFVEKLKETVKEKEDLIAKLKRQSEKYLDPKTGKFKPMASEELRGKFDSIASSFPDVDYTQYLKDSVKGNEEFEQDLEKMKELLARLGRRYAKLFKKIQGLVGQ